MLWIILLIVFAFLLFGGGYRRPDDRGILWFLAAGLAIWAVVAILT